MHTGVSLCDSYILFRLNRCNFSSLLKRIAARTAPIPFKALCAKYGIEDEAKASNMLITVKRRFKVVLEQHLRDSAISDDCLAGEVEEIRKFFPDIAQETE